MKEKGEGGSKLGRWLGAPVRALSRACDTYVRRMSACAGRMPTAHYGGRGGFAPGSMQAATFTSRSRRGRGGDGDGDDDVNELVRAMSQRQASSGRGARGGEDVAAAAVPVRSRSVAVGRIDEDAPCEFGADDEVRVGGPARRPAVRRARSVAVGAGFGAATKQGAGRVHG